MSKRSSLSPSETLQPTPKRPKSLPLDIGTLIEAQDVENLWFPAEVIQSNETEVQVHFLGWSERWDEWIEKDSSRLRRHRGWGTSTMPNDWQQESIIEALDMEGKWYPAKVLFVSQNSVMVHYQGWAAKWNEWLEKDSGRLRKLHSAQGQPATTTSLAKHAETHDDVCALCEEVGELVCCDGRCKRAFHRTCIPTNNPPPPEDADASVRWRCADCQSRRMRCFFCKQWGEVNVDVVNCGRKLCGKFYHPDCLASSLQPYASPLFKDAKACARHAAAARLGLQRPETPPPPPPPDEEEEEEDEDAKAAEAEKPWRPPEEAGAEDTATAEPAGWHSLPSRLVP